MVVSILAMPGPSSGCFVTTKSVREHKIVNGGKLQDPESSLICFVIAAGYANPLPVSISILAHFGFQSPCITRMSIFGVWSKTFWPAIKFYFVVIIV